MSKTSEAWLYGGFACLGGLALAAGVVKTVQEAMRCLAASADRKPWDL